MEKSFTVLEFILSIALIAIIAGLALPVYQSFQVKNNLNTTVNSVVQNLRRANGMAESVDGDSAWGLKILTGNMVLFRGTSYSGRDPIFDETLNFEGTFQIVSTLNPSGGDEIVFTKFTGETPNTGTLTLTNQNGDNRNITINSKGKIEY